MSNTGANSTPTLPKIVISDVQKMLADGKDREAIRQHYGLKKIDLKKLFMNPNLKGKKVHRDRIATRFEIVDDITPSTTTAENTENNEQVNAPVENVEPETPAATEEEGSAY